MIDVKSQIVLKILIKECKEGGYKIVETSDIISAMPEKYRVDEKGLKNILTFLEHSDCISIKYDDEGVYCLCVMPYGYNIVESSTQKKKAVRLPFWIFVAIFALALVASFVGSLLANLIHF